MDGHERVDIADEIRELPLCRESVLVTRQLHIPGLRRQAQGLGQLQACSVDHVFTVCLICIVLSACCTWPWQHRSTWKLCNRWRLICGCKWRYWRSCISGFRGLVALVEPPATPGKHGHHGHAESCRASRAVGIARVGTQVDLVALATEAAVTMVKGRHDDVKINKRKPHDLSNLGTPSGHRLPRWV